MRIRITAATAALLALVACGDTALEQGAVGAGAGAGAAVLLGGDVATGAATGAAANVIYCQSNPGKCSSAGTPL